MKAPLIIKWRYWNNAKCKVGRSSNYLNYIGTRDGVEKFDDSWRSRNATAKQVELIKNILKDAPGIKESDEYQQYISYPTRGNAQNLIGTVIDDYPKLLDKKTYLDYIGTRQNVEKFGTNGLFSDDGETLVMSQEREKLNKHNGRVNTLVISLSREDAESTGFNCAERWRSFMRIQKYELAKQFDIPPEHLRWYGAFHNEPTHPHVHVLLYSTDPDHEGYITKRGLERIKSSFATEIFRHELDSIYQEQTKQRDELMKIAREEIKGLVERIQSCTCDNLMLISMMQKLAEKMQSIKCKKAYSFLPKELKVLVNDITDTLTEDENIKKLYDLWYESKYAILKSYTEHLPPQKPLSQEEAFKPIRNAVIRETMKLSSNISKDEEHNTVSPYADSENSSTVMAVTRIMKYASRIIEDKISGQLAMHPELEVDSKLQREIEAKKRGIQIKM